MVPFLALVWRRSFATGNLGTGVLSRHYFFLRTRPPPLGRSHTVSGSFRPQLTALDGAPPVMGPRAIAAKVLDCARINKKKGKAVIQQPSSREGC